MHHGFRYKIAYALKEIDFAGNLYVIDTSKDALTYVKEKYRTLIPKSNIICINKKFDETSFDSMPNEIDLLLSNHPIDDMIISEFIQDSYNQNLNHEEFKNILTKAWIDLGKDLNKVEEITENVFSIFEKFLNIKNINLIVISQYKSNLYFKDTFKEMDEITSFCFNKIKKLVKTNDDYLKKVLEFYPFGDDERYLGKYLLDNTQNAKNWIVGNLN